MGRSSNGGTPGTCRVTVVVAAGALDTPAASLPVPDLPMAGETGGPLPGIDLHDARALAAVLDEGRSIDALR